MSDRGEAPGSPPDPDDSDRPDRAVPDPTAPAGGGGIPAMDDLMRMLGMPTGAGGGMPDLEAMLRSVFGQDARLPAELTQLLAALRADPSGNPMAAAVRRQFATLFGDSSPQGRLESARDIARKVLSVAGDRVVGEAQRREVAEAVGVAHLWIDPVTTLDPPAGRALAWSGADWVEATMPTWSSLVEPVADGVARAGSSALRGQLQQFGTSLDLRSVLGEAAPEGGAVDLSGVFGQIGPALEQLTGGMFAAQIGQAVGTLAADVLGGTEVGLPLVADEAVALLPARVAAFAEGLQIDPAQVRLYLAVREAARVRLFAQVPWLTAQLEAAVRDYGRHITIDTEAIEAAVRSIDVSDLAALQQAFSQAELFGRRTTAEQQAALTRLESTLALVEGWVDLVTEQAVAAHLPEADALREAVRRRRAGGPAQKAFAGLVGLELRPRRLVDARNLWAALQDAGGIELRDGSWQYPDLAPTAADLDDPLGYVEKRTAGPVRDAMDAELDRLLAAGAPPDPGPDEGRDRGGPPDADPGDPAGA